MESIDIRRFGMAFGTTLALIQLGCIGLMATVPREAQILFFNSLAHGADVDAILRTQMPVSEVLMGIVEAFILGWLGGATIASIYNFAGVRTNR